MTFAISIVKFYFKKMWFTFLCRFFISDISQQYCENFRKFEQMELVENLLQIYRILHNLHPYFSMGKIDNI